MLGGTSQVYHGRNVENPTLQGPLLLLSKALMAGAPAWLLAASLPSSSPRVSGGSAPLPCYYRWQVHVCLRQEGHEFYQFSWVPSATLLRCTGRGRRPGLLPGVPPEAGEAGRGPGRSWLDWTSLGGEGRMSFLPRSLSWNTGAVGRRSGYARGRLSGAPVTAPLGLERPGPRPVPSCPFSRFNRNVPDSSGCRCSRSKHTWHFCDVS